MPCLSFPLKDFCDFDEDSWQDDVFLYRDVARSFGIDTGVERSRSGKGAHAWIFFEEAIPASLARALGTLILSQCLSRRASITLESFDRFFPAQDFLPRGGFGNLIALPLQKAAREMGNSCFIDDELRPYEDQWEMLSKVRRLSHHEVTSLIEAKSPRLKLSERADGFTDQTWLRDSEIIQSDRTKNWVGLLKNREVEIVFGAMLKLSTQGFPSALVSKLKRVATFANPEFYKLQRMRMQTYPQPRFIFSGEIRGDEIALPRGVLDEVLRILKLCNAEIVIRDERIARKKIKVSFTGNLTEEQAKAVKVCKAYDLGILIAPPGAGKTVMACALMAERKVSTLILCHRQPLLAQWKERIHQFLGVPLKEIGNLSGSRKKMTGKIDLAMLQSLSRFENLSELAEMYSQIIIDECHHIPATSFESILKQLPSRYVLGLTATPYRKDGLERILFQQCGPARYEMKSVDGGALQKLVKVYRSDWRPEATMVRLPYHLLIESLVTDPQRWQLVAESVVESLRAGQFPLLVGDRRAHLDALTKVVTELIVSRGIDSVEIVRLDGEMSEKLRKVAIELARSTRAQGKPILLVATGSLVGEGFDLPELDTLILASPLSFEGRMVQYAGRIHRLMEGKSQVQIIDFLDSGSPVFIKMYRNRQRAYRKMGYEICELFDGMGSPQLRFG